MAVYRAPEGFIKDPATGLYVRETIVTDEKGVKYRHKMFFNDETGEYTQTSEPLPVTVPVLAPVRTEVRKPEKPAKARNKKKRGKMFYIGAAVVILIVAALTFSGRKDNYVPLTDEQIDEFSDDFIKDKVPEWSVDAVPYSGELSGGGIIR